MGSHIGEALQVLSRKLPHVTVGHALSYFAGICDIAHHVRYSNEQAVDAKC